MTEVKEGASEEETDGPLPVPSNNSGHVLWWLRIKALDSDRPEFES